VPGILSVMSVRGPLGATPQGAGFDLSGVSTLDGRAAASGSSRRALMGVAGLLVSGFVIAISAAGTATLLPESIRLALPAPLAGAFGAAGLNLHSGGAMVALGLMLVSYVVVVGAAGELSGRMVLTAIAALYALVLLAPPLISTDVFSYQAYARMGGLFGINPYLIGPHAIQPDSIFPYIGAKWSYIPSVYGPAFTVLSYVTAPLTIAASVIAYKAIAAVSSLAVVAVVWHLARARGVDPIKAIVLVGLNPLLVLYGIGGGHNDLLMLAASTGAVYLIVTQRGRRGGGLMVLAVAIKLTAGLLVPFAFAAGGAHRTRERRRDVAIGVGVGGILTLAVSLAVFGTGVLNLFPTIARSQSEGDWHSIPGLIGTVGPALAGHIVGWVLTAIFLGVVGWLLRRVWRHELDWVNAAGWATLAMLITAGSLLPWYVVWLLPLAAVSTDSRLFRAALWITGIVLTLQMLQFAGTGIFGTFPAGGSPFGP
jgi:Glycosyltransferase family 87